MAYVETRIENIETDPSDDSKIKYADVYTYELSSGNRIAFTMLWARNAGEYYNKEDVEQYARNVENQYESYYVSQHSGASTIEEAKYMLSGLMSVANRTITGSSVQAIDSQVNKVVSLNSQLKTNTVSFNDSNITYLNNLRTNNPTIYNKLTTEGSSALQPLTEVVDPQTGSITAQPLPEVEIDSETTLAEGGVVNTLPTGVVVGAILASIGIDTYGKWQYENNENFRNKYNELVAYPERQRYETEREKWLAETGLSDEEFEKYYVSLYHPDGLSQIGILRTKLALDWGDYGQKLKYFINKDMYEEIVTRLYEQGVFGEDIPEADEDTPTEEGSYSIVTYPVSSAMVSSAIGSYKSQIGGFDIATPTDFSSVSYAVQQLNVGENDVVYVVITQDAYHTYAGIFKYTFPNGNIELRQNIDGSFYANNGLYAGGYRITWNVLGELVSTESHSYSRQNTVLLPPNYAMASSVISSNFHTRYEYKEPSPIIKDTSDSTPSTLTQALARMNGLPSFETVYVNPDGTISVKNWVQIPVPVRTTDDETGLPDYKPEIDFDAEPEALPYPDVLQRTSTLRDPYSDPDIDPSTEKPYTITWPAPQPTVVPEPAIQPVTDPVPLPDPEPVPNPSIYPSPTDVIVPQSNPTTQPPTGGTPPTPTGGGGPVIVPVLPQGGSARLFTAYNPTEEQLNGANGLGHYLWDSSIVEVLAKFLQNPMDAIITLHQVYVTPPTSGSQHIKLGFLDSGVTSALVSHQYVELDCGTVNIPEYYTDARDYTPWTQVQIYLPFIGIVPLTPEDIIRSNIHVVYGVDLFTGAVLASVTVTKPDGVTQTMYQYSGNCGVEYPLTAGNINGVIKGLSGALTGGMFGGVAGAVVGGINGALSGGASVSRSGSFGANAGAMGYKKPYIIVNRKIPTDARAYNSFYGFPANTTVFLSACSGYTRVKSVHVERINRATDIEKNMIEEKLKSGVIIV